MSQAKPGDPAKDDEFEHDLDAIRKWGDPKNSRNLNQKHFLEMWTVAHQLKLVAQQMLEIRRQQSSIARKQPLLLPWPGWEGPDENPPTIEAEPDGSDVPLEQEPSDDSFGPVQSDQRTPDGQP